MTNEYDIDWAAIIWREDLWALLFDFVQANPNWREALNRKRDSSPENVYIRGTPITVAMIGERLRRGDNISQCLNSLTEITQFQVYAAIRYGSEWQQSITINRRIDHHASSDTAKDEDE